MCYDRYINTRDIITDVDTEKDTCPVKNPPESTFKLIFNLISLIGDEAFYLYFWKMIATDNRRIF